MNIEVSIGEAVDKYSILELKQKKIKDSGKLVEVAKELDTLQECKVIIEQNRYYYNLLLHINELIWDMTDQIKAMNSIDFSDQLKNREYAIISKNIFDTNQKRFRIKRIFNLTSNIKEQKSYAETMCHIIIDNNQTAFNKIAEINYLSIEYDSIFIDLCYRNLFPYITNFSNNPNRTATIIHVTDFTLNDSDKSLYNYHQSLFPQ
jgi:hypothetical protein